MIAHKYLSVVAALGLIFELLSVQPSFSIGTYTYGITALRQEFELPLRVPQVLPATLSTSYWDTASSILFTGDVLLARNIEHLMELRGSTYPFAGLQFSEFARDGYVVGNFEASIPQEHKPTAAGEMRFSVRGDLATKALTAAGFTHVSLANNHALDYGRKNYRNTGRVLLENNIMPFGDPDGFSERSTSIISVGSRKVAIIGLQALQEIPTEIEVKKTLTRVSRISDLQILYVHWGEEYVNVSNRSQRVLAEMFIRNGIDLIIGSHPHVVQEVERINGILVLYSLGNYVFDQYDSLETQEGLLVQLDFTKEPTVHLIPVSSAKNLSQPALMESAEHARFLSQLAKRSDQALASYIKAGTIPLYSLVATSTKMAMINK